MAGTRAAGTAWHREGAGSCAVNLLRMDPAFGLSGQCGSGKTNSSVPFRVQANPFVLQRKLKPRGFLGVYGRTEGTSLKTYHHEARVRSCRAVRSQQGPAKRWQM